MKWMKALLLSIGIMTAASGIILAVTALVVGKTGALPREAAPLITTITGCAAVFLGGFFASIYMKEKGILLGIASGALFAVCTLLISMLLFQNPFTAASAGKAAAAILSGSIGGILGVNKKSKVKF